MPATTRTTHSSRDLLQEPDIRVVQRADVRNVISLHGDPARSHAEGPSCVTLGVDSGVLEDAGMHHAGTEDLGPAGSLTRWAASSLAELALHVHLRRRLCEWEVAWPKTRPRRAEEAAR